MTPRFRNIVVLTGAGVSAASGLPTYRGAGGVWEKHNVEEFGTIEGFRRAPDRGWQLFGSLRPMIQAAQPNDAHLALARFEASLAPQVRFLVTTQNVDGLHQRAGSRNVAELHGRIMRSRCDAGCGQPPVEDSAAHADEVPKCPSCGGLWRPDIVLFNEITDIEATWRTKRALRDVELFVAVGTSGNVSPASSFVRWARDMGARTVLVNAEPARDEEAFHERMYGKAEVVLPRFLESLA